MRNLSILKQVLMVVGLAVVGFVIVGIAQAPAAGGRFKEPVANGDRVHVSIDGAALAPDGRHVAWSDGRERGDDSLHEKAVQGEVRVALTCAPRFAMATRARPPQSSGGPPPGALSPPSLLPGAQCARFPGDASSAKPAIIRTFMGEGSGALPW